MTSLPQIAKDYGQTQTHASTGTILDAASEYTIVTADIASLYIHIPFCFHKCHYCDFYSFVDTRDRQPAFVDRLVREMIALSEWITQPLETIFIGGGTPTLLDLPLWEQLLRSLGEHYLFAPTLEFTVEANPETISPELMHLLASGGVNRISIGAQSFNPAHLKTLERHHDPANVIRGVQMSRAAGIDNINLDLIFAIPGQTLDDWLDDLRQAVEIEPMHLSCYSLMYEPNTALTARLRAGQVQRAEDDLEAAMYEITIDRLKQAGFDHYEISNWAQSDDSQPGDARCQHNLVYWRNRNWLGLGPSASAHVDGLRWKNVPRVGEYLATGPLPPVTDTERLDPAGRAGEELMLTLRLREGMPIERVNQLLTIEPGGSTRTEAIDRHLSGELLHIEENHLRLTQQGFLLADTVLADLI